MGSSRGCEEPANYPDIARYLAQIGIDSINVNPSNVLRTFEVAYDAEKSTNKATE